MRTCLLCAVVSLAAAAPVSSQDGAGGGSGRTPDSQRPGIGAEIKALDLVDIRYLRRSLQDLVTADGATPVARKGTVLFFVTNECPLVLRYLPEVEKLAGELRPKGIAFAAINVGPGDPVREMAACAVEHRMSIPFLKDMDGELARACGVERTATAVLLDRDQRLAYRGRIDQRYRFSGVSPRAGRADLREAVLELLAGKPCSVATTPVEGCAITWPRAPADPELTFCRDIAPIVQAHCADCHHKGGEAPFELSTYEDIAGRGEMVAEVVRQQRMPPWHASEAYGTFANHRGLSAEQIGKIVAWIGGGMKQGDPAHLPPPRKFTAAEWRIGEPDLVLKLPFKIKLPAGGYVPYKYFAFPYRFPADTWVERIEIKPQNRKVLHHANLARVRDLEYEPGGFITGQVPGGDPMVLDPGTALLIPKGYVLAIQCHYVTTGKPEHDRLQVGLRFPRGVVHRQLHHLQIGHSGFRIPPHATHHPVERSKTIPFDAEGIGLFAHMHLRGTDMRFTAVPPGGDPEDLLLVPNYNFEWQQSYRWNPASVFFAAGTRILVQAHYDNSAFNPFNPDPNRAVPYGARTDDEMMFGFVFFLRRGEDLLLRIDPKTGHVEQ